MTTQMLGRDFLQMVIILSGMTKRQKTKQIDLSKKFNVGDPNLGKTIMKYNLTIGGQKWSLSQQEEPHLIYEPRYYFVSKVK